MRTSAKAAQKAKPYAELVSQRLESAELKDLIVKTLDDAKAENVVTIDVKTKSSIGDFMVIATGHVNRHVSAISDRVVEALKEAKHGSIKVEGMPECNWVLIDTGPVIVHVFQPEAREFYKLEKMWSGDRPVELVHDLTGEHRDGGVDLDRDIPVS
jgi:ribosome-associated protein